MGYKVEKDWEHKGLRCVVIAADMGHRCGYVGVDSTHPLFNLDYRDDVPASLAKAVEKVKEGPVGKRGIIDIFCTAGSGQFRVGILFNVHGGITFSSGAGIYPVESDLWWFGFDCGHAGDAKDESIMSKKYKETFARYPDFGGIVRTLDYCVEECESLARQLNEIKEVT